MRIELPCDRCRRRGFCRESFCPEKAKQQAMFKVKPLLKKDFFGSSPAPFVGRFGYPHLNVGILSPTYQTENVWEYDAPRHWAQNNYNIGQVIDFRSALVNSRFKAHIKDSNKLLATSQEVAMASKPVDVEINLEKKPFFSFQQSSYWAPMGPNAKVKKVKITENTKIHRKVDKVVSDTDLKASEALLYLYQNAFDENILSRILSVGNLGIRKNRKLVPTRWSITAIDDTIGKDLRKKVQDFPETGYLAFFGSYLGNYYLCMTFPDLWSYELFEMYIPTMEQTYQVNRFSTDYESHNGRKDYAHECAGGYYTVKLAVLEQLLRMKRQASVLVLRFITDEYASPLGVWVTRESARKALSSKPIEFSSEELLIKYAKSIAKMKFNCNIDNVLERSLLLRAIKTQSKLSHFL